MKESGPPARADAAPPSAALAPGEARIDAVNASAYRRPDIVDVYAGWDSLEAAERTILDRVAPEVRGGKLLDIGVGGGRTVAALTRLSADYTAIDYSPAMVEACGARYPNELKLVACRLY